MKKTLRKTACSAVFIVATGLVQTVLSEEYATDDNGRTILLNNDGTWVEVVRDRLATTKDGRRIRLKSNGRWQLDAAQPKSSVPANTQDDVTGGVRAKAPVVNRVNADSISLVVSSAEVLKKKTKGLKSTRLESRTRYRIALNNQSGQVLDLAPWDSSKVTVKAKSGKQFSVLSANFQQQTVGTGDAAQLEIVADGSPFWLTRNPIDIIIEAGALGDMAPKVLRIDPEQFDIRQVDGF